jgi:hypothetical protein
VGATGEGGGGAIVGADLGVSIVIGGAARLAVSPSCGVDAGAGAALAASVRSRESRESAADALDDARSHAMSERAATTIPSRKEQFMCGITLTILQLDRMAPSAGACRSPNDYADETVDVPHP